MIRLRTSISRPVPDLAMGAGVSSIVVAGEGIVALSARPPGILPMDGSATFRSVMGEFSWLGEAIVIGDGSVLSYVSTGE